MTVRPSTTGRRRGQAGSNGPWASCSTGWRTPEPRKATRPAIEAARRRVELDPLDEAGQRRLIDLLARSGDRAGAIRQYRSLVALLDHELGVAPLRETTDRYESIREDRPGVAAPVAPAAIPALPGLPLAGRDRELAAIVAAARDARPDGRLVVVEGEAGIGKTRLGEAVASPCARPAARS